MPPQRAQIQAVINPPQQVIGQDVRFEIERAEQPTLIAALLTHHLDTLVARRPPPTSATVHHGSSSSSTG
jgi:hypothetical protein